MSEEEATATKAKPPEGETSPPIAPPAEGTPEETKLVPAGSPVYEGTVFGNRCAPFRHATKVAWYLFKHTLSVYSKELPPTNLSSTFPPGKLGEEHFKVCKQIYDEEVTRRSALESKASHWLSLCGVLVPMAVSVLVYTLTKTHVSSAAKNIVVGLDILAVVSVVLAFVAIVRANSVKIGYALSANTIFERESGNLHSVDFDYHARGLLWCANMNSSLNSFLADFVRAAQCFVLVSIALLISGGAVIAGSLRPPEEKPTQIAGKVAVDTAALTGIVTEVRGIATAVKSASQDDSSRRALAEKIEGLTRRINQLEQELRGITTAKTAKPPRK